MRWVLLVVKLGNFIEIFAVLGVVWCVITVLGIFTNLVFPVRFLEGVLNAFFQILS